MAQPPGADQLHGRRDHGDRGGVAVPRRRGRGAGADRRKDFAMSEDVTAATPSKQWFVGDTHSGFENQVKEAVESRGKIFGMSEQITRVLAATEKGGVVDDMSPERGRMKVVVPVFGRPTSVELEYYQVERI